MSVIGVVYNSGMALPETVDELKYLIDCTENVTISRFFDLPTAYMEMMKEYENRGIANKILLPAPTLENLAAVRFFNTEDFAEIFERNRLKTRWFTLWSLESYGIFTDIDNLVNSFFTPGGNFILTEVTSSDEALKDLFTKYARVTFPVWPYCGGVPLPMLGNQFTCNVLCRAQYRQYLATNCVIPQELHSLLPVNSGVNTAVNRVEIAGIIENHEGGNLK